MQLRLRSGKEREYSQVSGAIHVDEQRGHVVPSGHNVTDFLMFKKEMMFAFLLCLSSALP